MPHDDVVARVQSLKPRQVADDVLQAVADLGGKAQRREIIDRALKIGGWSAEELEVPAWWKQTTWKQHLRAITDSAVDLCGDRGLLEMTGVRGGWRLSNSAGTSGVGSVYRPAGRLRPVRPETAVVEVDLNNLDARTAEHMALQDQLSVALLARDISPLSWRPPEPQYDLAFELSDELVVVEVKTLGVGSATQQMRLGTGQLLEYRHRLVALYGRPVHAILLTSAPAEDPWPDALLSWDITLIAGPDIEEQLKAALDHLRPPRTPASACA